MTDNSKITIAQIAVLAGVSKATVSRVLSGNTYVSEQMRQKVLAVMEQIQYKPNLIARGLATGKLNIVALIVSDIRNPFFAELVSAINASLQEKGYLVMLFNCTHVDDYDMLQRIMSYGYSGVIIADALNDLTFGQVVRGAGCPVVLVNRDSDILADYDAVMMDNTTGGYLATKHLLELGHRNIAMLRGPLTSTASTCRYQGYCKALLEYDVQPAKQHLGVGDFTIEAGEQFAEELLTSKGNRATAAFVGNDYMAIGMLNVCKRRGVTVPEQFSVVGFDDIPLSSTELINLTTVQQPFTKIAELVTDKLVARMSGEEKYAEKVTLMPRLIVRQTTSAPDR